MNILHITYIYIYITYYIFTHYTWIYAHRYIHMCHGSTYIIGRDGLKQHSWGLLSIELLGILFWSDSYWPNSYESDDSKYTKSSSQNWEFHKIVSSSWFEIWYWHLPGVFLFFWPWKASKNSAETSRWNKSWTSRRTASHPRRWTRHGMARCGDDWGNHGKPRGLVSDGWWW